MGSGTSKVVKDKNNQEMIVIQNLEIEKLKKASLKTSRYNSIAKKHINAKDDIKGAKKAIETATTADYSVLNNLSEEKKKNPPLHHAKGKEIREKGGYVLEFVCAGSSNNQFAKTYKGFTGRNDKAEITRIPTIEEKEQMEEIRDTINQKYKIDFKGVDENNYEPYREALDKEFGKYMYEDAQGNLHDEPKEGYKPLVGIRKRVDDNRTRISMSGAMGKVFGKAGLSNSGDYDTKNTISHIKKEAEKWLDNVYTDYLAAKQKAETEGKQIEFKPIEIYIKGHSRGAVAANEGSMAINYLLEHKYQDLKPFVHMTTLLFDPVPGFGSDLQHPTMDHNKADSVSTLGNNVRGLNCSKEDRQRNNSTLFVNLSANHALGFTPQTIKGTNKVVLTCMKHDTGVFDAVDGHKRGYINSANGEEYRGSGFSDLKDGFYLLDENKNLMEIKNPQEAHNFLNAAYGRRRFFSSQYWRHSKMHDYVDAYFETHPYEITPKDTRYPVAKYINNIRGELGKAVEAMDSDLNPQAVKGKDTGYPKLEIAKLFVNQQLLNEMKAVKANVYPSSQNAAVQLLSERNRSRDAFAFADTKDFDLFCKSLSKDDLRALASGNDTVTNAYIKNYRDFTALPQKEKEHVGAKPVVDLSTVGMNKTMFFEKYTGKDGKFYPPVSNRLNFSADRGALNMLATAHMLMMGHNLKDILDPTKLNRERQEAGDAVMDAYLNMPDSSLKAWAAESIASGMQMALDQYDDAIGKLPSLSPQEMDKPENAFLLGARNLIVDFGQEAKHVKGEIEELYSESYLDKLIDRQSAGQLVTQKFIESNEKLDTMINGVVVDGNNGIGPMLNGENVGTFAANLSGVFVASLLQKKLEAENLDKSFSERIDANECLAMIQSGDITFKGSGLCSMLNEFIEDQENPGKFNMENLRKLGHALKDGKILDSINMQLDSNGFSISNDEVDKLMDKLESYKIPKSLKAGDAAVEKYRKSKQLTDKISDKSRIKSEFERVKKSAERDIKSSCKEFSEADPKNKQAAYGKLVDSLGKRMYIESAMHSGKLDPAKIDAVTISESVDKIKGKVETALHKMDQEVFKAAVKEGKIYEKLVSGTKKVPVAQGPGKKDDGKKIEANEPVMF